MSQIVSSSLTHNTPVLVHSHLRWDWVWQRPQQFLSRLAKKRRILFCEGPRLFNDQEEGTSDPYYKLYQPEGMPNLWVMQTYLPESKFGDGEWVDNQRLKLVKQVVCEELARKFEQPIQWFYDPMAVHAFIGHMGESATVYDCMDELSKFRFAPPELINRERRLLQKADVVFAGGRRMWESKQKVNANSHFYGCGVDVEHFGKARRAETELPADLAAIRAGGKPVLGYFGVVDERLDYDLIAKLADAEPDWEIAMVGPVCKVDEKDLPKRSNLHWLGGRDYSELPAYCKGFDACLMPFARNEATEYINPTKALEYMATARPIVSTDVPDVVSNFSTVVKIATKHDEFLAFCRAAVSSPDQIAVERGLRMANDNTWDAIVAKLDGHIEDALARKKQISRSVQSNQSKEYGRAVSAA